MAAFAAENQEDTWDGTADTSWYDKEATEFHIWTAEQLAGMSELLEKDMYSFKDKTIYLETYKIYLGRRLEINFQINRGILITDYPAPFSTVIVMLSVIYLSMLLN